MSANMKGQLARYRGEPIESCPYHDHRTNRGAVTWSRGFFRDWCAGWRYADSMLHVYPLSEHMACMLDRLVYNEPLLNDDLKIRDHQTIAALVKRELVYNSGHQYKAWRLREAGKIIQGRLERRNFYEERNKSGPIPRAIVLGL